MVAAILDFADSWLTTEAGDMASFTALLWQRGACSLTCMKRLAYLFAVTAILACGEDPESALEPGFIGIDVTPQFYRGTAGRDSGDTITVTVTDHRGRRAAGVRTSFGAVYSFASGSLAPDTTGHVRALTTRTDANGQVRAIWKFAHKAGYQETSVSVADLQRETFAAEVQPQSTHTLAIVAPSAPMSVGSTYNIPIRAEDAYGNEILLVSWQIGTIPNRRPVTWTVSDPTILTVDSLGRASLHRAGNASVTAEVEGRTATIAIPVVEASVVLSPVR